MRFSAVMFFLADHNPCIAGGSPQVLDTAILTARFPATNVEWISQ